MKYRKPFQILVGTFGLGHENVDLYLCSNDGGGSFYFQPDDKARARIKIDIMDCTWSDCVAYLVHEAMEFLMTREQHRFVPTGKTTRDMATYLFVFTHSDFTEHASRLASFLVDTMPVVAKHYNARNPKKK